MKLMTLFLLLIGGLQLAAQEDPVLIEAKLYLPAHVVKGLSANQLLVVHYVMEESDGKMTTGKFAARKIKDNIYSFPLKRAMFFRLVFGTGDYSTQLFCVDNRNGKAAEEYDFNLLLEKKRFDPADLKFIAPCVQREEE